MVELKCIECGNNFLAKNKRFRYCENCKQEVINRRAREYASMKWRQTHTVITSKPCAVCGKVFDVYNGNCKYCSDECKKTATAQHRREWWKTHPRRYDRHQNLMDRFCIYCGNMFTPQRLKDVMCCSDDCLLEYKRERGIK